MLKVRLQLGFLHVRRLPRYFVDVFGFGRVRPGQQENQLEAVPPVKTTAGDHLPTGRKSLCFQIAALLSGWGDGRYIFRLCVDA